MGKILLLGVIVWCVLTIVKRYQKSLSYPPQDQQTETEDMVRCARCGVHIPKKESLSINQQYYCCETHSQ